MASLAGAGGRRLQALFRAGHAPEPARLAGWEYSGVTLPGTSSRLLGARTFVQGFLPEQDGQFVGYTRNIAGTVTHDTFAVRPVGTADVASRYPNTIVFDYGADAGLAARRRDYVVGVEGNSDDLLLGRAFLAVGRSRVPVGWFAIQRSRRIDHWTGRVAVDDAGVRVEAGAVRWAELAAVNIRRSEGGLAWELHRASGSVVTAGAETPGIELLTARLRALPGFDVEAATQAEASAGDAVLPCWRRRAATLREENDGSDVRWLGAYVDAVGDLHIDGHDLGPGTAAVSADGEYEWFKTVAAADVPRLVAILGGDEGDDVLDLLAARWTGPRSYDFERALRESGIAVTVSTWGG